MGRRSSLEDNELILIMTDLEKKLKMDPNSKGSINVELFN